MPPIFYQHYYFLVGNYVTKTVLDFLNHGISPLDFNETHVVLIPKIENPRKITQLRPISLSNVVSKLASKVLANRLKQLLPHIISENQSDFISEHLITDNVLVTFETMHHINQKKSGKVGEMVVKLDMSKTYDRVEWGCLEKIMLKMGFHVKWINIMMSCVRSVSYSIRINGKPRGHITPTQGLSQGDPFSPYLFFICAESLSALLTKFVEDGLLKGSNMPERANNITVVFLQMIVLFFVKPRGKIALA